MESGSAVRYKGEGRVPQFAAQLRFATGSWESHILNLATTVPAARFLFRPRTASFLDTLNSIAGRGIPSELLHHLVRKKFLQPFPSPPGDFTVPAFIICGGPFERAWSKQ
jgi:hypothetical protein